VSHPNLPTKEMYGILSTLAGDWVFKIVDIYNNDTNNNTNNKPIKLQNRNDFLKKNV
jgi:hypothetical protein